MKPPRYAYLSNSELLRAAQDPMVETLDREALLDLVVELTAALDDLHSQYGPNSGRTRKGGPNYIRPINLKEKTCSN